MATNSARSLFLLFQGYTKQHGVWDKSKAIPDKNTGKIEKGMSTHNGPPTEELWSEHLKGKVGLGVLPLLDDNTNVLWAAIDIDDKKVDFKALERRCDELNLPVLICRSKSGGAHLYTFFNEPIPADVVKEKLAEWGAALGYSESAHSNTGKHCDIFPRQIGRTEGKDGSPPNGGSWINMPWYGGDKGDRRTFANGDWATLQQFIDAAFDMKEKLTEDAFRSIEVSYPQDEDDLFDFAEGPPCLNTLSRKKFPEGVRNDSLFNICIYLRKRWPDDWKDRVFDYNRHYMTPALTVDEVNDIIKSVGRKGYDRYTCKREPIASVCQSRKCWKMKYGVGQVEQQNIQFEGLSKLNTKPPKWFLQVNGREVRLKTDELKTYARLEGRLLEEINVVLMIKPAAWKSQLAELMSHVVEIEAPPNTGESDAVWDHIVRFCRREGDEVKKEAKARGGPWKSVKRGVYLFEPPLLEEWMKKEKVTATRSDLWEVIQAHGGGNEGKTSGGKKGSIYVWSLPISTVPEDDDDDEELEVQPYDEGGF